MNYRLHIVMLCGAASLTALAAGWPAATQAQTKGGTLSVALETDVRGFDAVKGGVLGASGGTVAFTIEEPIVKWDNKAKKYVPNLALSWTSSDNLKVWTFKLRQGVKFHDGSDFTSKDAADQLNRILDPKNKARGRSFITAIAKAEAVDPHTVQYTLKHAWLPFLGAISGINLNGLITSHKATEAKTQNRHPIGTGPFVFKKWAGGDRIEVERNPNYWNKDAVHLDKIVFRIMPDTQTRFASLKAGEVDVIWTDRGNSIVRAQKDPDLTTITRDGAGAKITFFNAGKPPLDDQRVRAALSHAFSQQAILNVT